MAHSFRPGTGRYDPFGKSSANDGVDGAPNGISVPRWSLSKPHLKGEAVHGQVYPEFVDCHAGWSRSGEESVSGSRRRREGRDRCGAQTHAQPADPVLRRAAAVRGAMEACSSAHHWGRALIELGHEVRLIPPAHVKPYVRRNKN